jgi:hypothetical protein
LICDVKTIACMRERRRRTNTQSIELSNGYSMNRNDHIDVTEKEVIELCVCLSSDRYHVSEERLIAVNDSISSIYDIIRNGYRRACRQEFVSPAHDIGINLPILY